LKIENRINEQIRIPSIRLIDENGQMVGIVPTYQAKQYALGVELDLVEISPNANPPVCKVMDFGKYKYEQEKKAKEHKQVSIKTKEILFHPNISDHDYGYRVEQAKKFLEHGDKVKANMTYRGRELNYFAAGKSVLNRFIEDLSGLCVVENESFEGKTLSVTVRKP
jgi:translation initiation factor IF-3